MNSRQLTFRLQKCLPVFLFISILIACQAPQDKKSQSGEIEKQLPANATEKLEDKTTSLAKNVKALFKVDTLLGIDVSHYQGDVDWAQIKAQGLHFGIAKATQGDNFIDPKFERNWKAISEQGLYRGAYHFYSTKSDPLKQAEHFVKTVKSIGQHHLRPIIDLEGANIGGLVIEKYQNDVLVWLNYVEQHLGEKPMIYVSHYFGDKYLNNKIFGKYDLWVAAYTPSIHVPEVWSKKGWTGWQFSPDTTFAGVNGKVDVSRFLRAALINS